MLERIKPIGNPLTIIAIFAGLAEVLGTIALKLVAAESQATFIWFVMLFPTLIVLLFFATLNFNNKVLYAPSDYKDEENFLRAIWGVKKLSINLDQVQKELEMAKLQIHEAAKQISEASDQEHSPLEGVVNLISSIQKSVENTKESAGEIVAQIPLTNDSGGLAPSHAMTLLGSEDKWYSATEIAQRAGVTEQKAIATLSKLQRMGIAKVAASDGGALYRLTDSVLSSSKPDNISN